MKESTLWGHLKPALRAVGKFQKISDRFTPGVPDALGCWCGVGVAAEFKELEGVRVLRTKFRPGQLDWLRDWEREGGISWIISSHRQTIYVHRWEFGREVEKGSDPTTVRDRARAVFTKTRGNTWRDFVTLLATLDNRLKEIS